jgi:hypothetical protein
MSLRRTAMPPRTKPLKTKRRLQTHVQMRRIAELERRRRDRSGDPAATDSEETIRLIVYTRAIPPGWGIAVCELCGETVRWDDYDCHHRKFRSAGGPDTPENRACLHHDCHVSGGRNPMAVHREVAYARDVRGLIVSAAEPDPGSVPVTLPDGRTVRFTTDGRYEDLEAA